jgi:hypothetical protein
LHGGVERVHDKNSFKPGGRHAGLQCCGVVQLQRVGPREGFGDIAVITQQGEHDGGDVKARLQGTQKAVKAGRVPALGFAEAPQGVDRQSLLLF